MIYAVRKCKIQWHNVQFEQPQLAVFTVHLIICTCTIHSHLVCSLKWENYFKRNSKNNLHSSITAEIIGPNAGLALRIFFSLCHSAINHSLAWILHAHLTSAGYILPAPAPVTSTPSLGPKLTAHRKVSWSDSETDFKWYSSTAIVCVRASVPVCVWERFTCSL